MKQRSKLLTLVSLSTALDVKFSLFDALDEAEAEAAEKRADKRKAAADHRHIMRAGIPAYAQSR